MTTYNPTSTLGAHGGNGETVVKERKMRLHVVAESIGIDQKTLHRVYWGFLGQCRKMTNFDEAKKCEKALFYAGFQHFAIHSNLLNYTRLTTVSTLRFEVQNTTEICSTSTKVAKQYSASENQNSIL